MLDWAKREIELAKNLEKAESGDIDYSGACYDSALKAFESLLGDGHSGMSIVVARYILNRLIDGQPLTPIEDTPDMWNEVAYDKEYKFTTFQSKRMSSLFKYVYDSGVINYKDIDRILCIDIHAKSAYHSGLVENVINRRYPLTIPYMPTNAPLKVYCEDFLTDPANGDSDTLAILYLILPDDSRIYINEYYKEDSTNQQWVGITLDEYIERSITAGFVSHMKGKEV